MCWKHGWIEKAGASSFLCLIWRCPRVRKAQGSWQLRVRMLGLCLGAFWERFQIKSADSTLKHVHARLQFCFLKLSGYDVHTLHMTCVFPTSKLTSLVAPEIDRTKRSKGSWGQDTWFTCAIRCLTLLARQLFSHNMLRLRSGDLYQFVNDWDVTLICGSALSVISVVEKCAWVYVNTLARVLLHMF